jgi:hypothetical protein
MASTVDHRSLHIEAGQTQDRSFHSLVKDGDKPPSTLTIDLRINRKLTTKCWVGFIDWLGVDVAISLVILPLDLWKTC